MIINKDFIKIYDTFNIRLTDSVLVTLEDALRKDKEMLVTIAASHYGMRNKNWTVYRHDTVKKDISTFVAPTPRPIIQQHKPKESEVFGRVIAADYKLTDKYRLISSKYTVEGLSTEEYVSFVKNTILPLQLRDKTFDGLAYLELVGKLDNKEGIKKVLNKEFISVSIGARPYRLICSECLSDQLADGICEHFGSKYNNTFMLSESLEYQELSFVNKPADPFGRITRIHDGIEENISTYELDQLDIQATVNAIPLRDFFELTDKKIVCMDNICAVINQEDSIMPPKKEMQSIPKTSISYIEEFGREKCLGILEEKGFSVELKDVDYSSLSDRQFAIVQQDGDTIKRRFSVVDEQNIILGKHLLEDAIDLSPLEKEKANTILTKAAKKFAIDCQVTKTAQDIITDAVTASERTIETITEEIKQKIETFDPAILKDEDDKPNPISTLFGLIASLGNDLEWAGKALKSSISYYLENLGKKVIEQDEYVETQTLKDKAVELEEEVKMLNDQNISLNRLLRDNFVEEILTHKKALSLIEDSVIEEEKIKYSKLTYEALNVLLNDFRAMRVKLTDSIVSNNITIKRITDPTQIADSVQDGLDDTRPDQNKPKLTTKDAINVINSLKQKAMF